MAITPDQPTELELARRILVHGAFLPVEMRTDLVVGALPAALADQVAVPSGTRLVGSALHSRQGRPSDLEVVLDASGEPTEVVDACEKDLTERGWNLVEGFPGSMHGGFVSGPFGFGRMLRKGEQGPVLMMSAVTRDAGLTDLRLRLDWDIPRHLDRMTIYRSRLSGFEQDAPALSTHGREPGPRGGGGSGGRWNSEAMVETDRSVAELEAHFASQLVEAGWTRVAGRADDVVGWSTWRLPGEGELRGLLLVLAVFGGQERSLTLRIEEAEPDDNGPGGRSSHQASHDPIAGESRQVSFPNTGPGQGALTHT